MNRRIEDLNYYEEYIMPLSRFIFSFIFFKIGNISITQDLAQVTMMKAWEKLHQLKDRKKAKPWVLSIAKSVVAHYYRDRREVQLLAEFPDEKITSISSVNTISNPADILELKDEKAYLDEILDCLRPEEKRILERHYFDEIPYTQISEEMDMNYDTVRMMSSRAIAKLRKKVKLAESEFYENHRQDGDKKINKPPLND